MFWASFWDHGSTKRFLRAWLLGLFFCFHSVFAEDLNQFSDASKSDCSHLISKGAKQSPQFSEATLRTLGLLFRRLHPTQQNELSRKALSPSFEPRHSMAHPLSPLQLEVMSRHAAHLGDLRALKLLESEAGVKISLDHLQRAALGGQEHVVAYLLDEKKLVERHKGEIPLQINPIQAAAHREHFYLASWFLDRAIKAPEGSNESEVLRSWLNRSDHLKISVANEMAMKGQYDWISKALKAGILEQPKTHKKNGLSWALKILTSPKVPPEQIPMAMRVLHDGGYDFKGDDELMNELLLSGNAAAVVLAFEYGLYPKSIPKSDVAREFIGNLTMAYERLGLEFKDYPGLKAISEAQEDAPSWFEDSDLMEVFPTPESAVRYLTLSPSYGEPVFYHLPNPLWLARRGNYPALMEYLSSPKAEPKGMFLLPTAESERPTTKLPLATAVLHSHNLTPAQLVVVVKELQKHGVDWNQEVEGLSALDYAYRIGFPRLILMLNEYGALPSGQEIWKPKNSKELQAQKSFQQMFAKNLEILGFDELFYPGVKDVSRAANKLYNKAIENGDRKRALEIAQAKGALLANRYYLIPNDRRFKENNFGSTEW